MAHISENVNYSNHKINFYDKMRKITVNLGSNTGVNNGNSSPQLTYIQNSLLTSIVDTPEKGLSNVHRKYYMRKLRTLFRPL